MKPLEINEYKDVYNAWIDPEGILYKCGYMEHNEWVREYFEWKNDGDFLKQMKK